jgi:hypothetical protein
MKYSLTIHDLTAQQVSFILSRVENNTEVKSVYAEQIIEANNTPPIGSPDAIAAVINQNVAASNITADDMDSVFSASTNQLLQSNKTSELDSAGLPWDERIHSGSKKKNADGKWKLRKNVDEALVGTVEAQNRSGTQTSVPVFLQNMPAAAPVTVPVIPAAPVAVVAPSVTRDFSGLMIQISKLFANKQITPDYPTTIVNRVNAGFNSKIKTLTDVQHDARMVEYSWQCLDVDGKAA